MKKMISAFLAILMLISLCVPAFSAYIASVAESNKAENVKMKWFSKDDWHIVSGVNEIHMRSTGSSNMIYITSAEKTGTMKVAYEPDNVIDLSKYNELGFQLTLSNGNSCVYEVTYYYDGGTFTDSVSGEKGTRNIAYFALPFEKADSISRIELSVENTENNLNYFAIEDIFADNCRTYSYAQRFCSRQISNSDGKAVYNNDYVEVVPDENGAHIELGLIKNYEEATALVVAEVQSPHSGIITLENTETGILQTAALYSGTVKYSFMVTGLTDSLELGFYEGDVTSEAPVRFLSLDIIKVSDEEAESMGSIESCVYENNRVTLRGTLKSDVAVKYIDAKLALYKVPYDYDGEEELPEAEAEMNISTVFEISADAEYDHTQWKYLIAISTKTDIIPVASSVFAFAHSSLASVGQNCSVGVHNVETTTAFESEADDVVMDIDLSKLFTGSNTSAAHRFAYKDSVYYLDSDYVNEITSKIGFYTSTGGKVYLRIVSNGEDTIKFTPDDPSSIDILCATAAYIGTNLKKVSGVIAFSGYGCGEEPADKAFKLSLMLGMFASSLRKTNPAVEIYLSVDSEDTYNAPLVAYFNKSNGISNIGLAYECRSVENSVPCIRALSDMANNFSSPFRNYMLFWKPDGIIKNTDSFADLYDEASKSGISNVVLSPSDSVATDVVYSCFAGVHGEDYVRYEFNASKEKVNYRGAYSLWDFSDAYDIFGWLAGGSCSSPETVFSSEREGRALRTAITPSRGDEGILVCWLEGATDLSAADAMKMEFFIDANTGEAMPVTFVLGGEGIKAEYKSEVYYGENTIYADLGLFPESDKLEYVAVIVGIDKEATFEIYDISVVSRELGSSELKSELVSEKDNIRDYASVYIFVGAIVSATVVIFAILSKKSGIKQINSK